jgi:hypothetical protein
MEWYSYPVGRAHDPGDNAAGGELGIDLSTPVGTPITTPWPATVTYVGTSASTGGIVKALTNVPGIGAVFVYFLHLTTIAVKPNQALSGGQLVGLSGGLQPGAGGWAHVEFGLFKDVAYAHQYWGFVTGSTLDPTPVILALRKGGGGMVPNGWHDDGVTLTAPNNVPVVKGFRTFILNNPWTDYNYPLHPEYVTSSVEPGNPAIGAGSRQDFRLGSLGYTTSKGVYQVWIGQDYEALQAQVAADKATIGALQARIAAALQALGG